VSFCESLVSRVLTLSDPQYGHFIHDFPSQYSERFAAHTYLVFAQAKRTLYIVFYYIKSFYTDMKKFS